MMKRRIDEVCNLIKGEYPTMKTPPGDYPLVVTAAERRSADSYQIVGPAVCVPIISSTGHGHAAIHRIHYQEGKFALANLLVALQPKAEGIIDMKYIYWLLTAKKDEYFVPQMIGTANVSLKIKDIGSVDVPLPPLDEQRRIVAKIEAIAAKVEEAKRLSEESRSKIDALVDRKLVCTFDILSKKYPNYLLGEVCNTSAGGTPSRSNPAFYGGEIPWVKSGELEGRVIKSVEEYITKEAIAGSSTKIFKKGTLVIALYGATVGKTGVLGLDAATNQAVCSVIPKEGMERDYVWWFLRRMRPVFIGNSFGGAQPNISQRLLRKIEIPVPPQSEQYSVVEYLNIIKAKVSELKALQEKTAVNLNALLPSVLDRAFKGEL